jgi:hypothetical protein
MILRFAVELPFDNVGRASLLVSLGLYVSTVYGSEEEPLTLGEQAIALLEGGETWHGLIQMGKAQALVADFTWPADRERSERIAASAAAIFDRALQENSALDPSALCEVFFAAIVVKRILGRFEEAIQHCEQTVQAASDRIQSFNGSGGIGLHLSNGWQTHECARSLDQGDPLSRRS